MICVVAKNVLLFQAPTVIFGRIEQTLFALCSSRYGVELLPEAYDVHLDEGIRGPVRHYVGAVRQQMYGEGIRRLLTEDFLSL